MPGCATTRAGQLIAGLTTHTSLILHTRLQGKLAALPSWDFYFFIIICVCVCVLDGKKVEKIVCVVQYPLIQKTDTCSFKMFECLPSELHNVVHSLPYDYQHPHRTKKKKKSLLMFVFSVVLQQLLLSSVFDFALRMLPSV